MEREKREGEGENVRVHAHAGGLWGLFSPKRKLGDGSRICSSGESPAVRNRFW